MDMQTQTILTDDKGAPGVPYSTEAEQAVLGSVIISPEIWTDVNSLRADDFYIHKHRFIWDALIHLQECETPIDIVTVADELERAGTLAEIGGASFLTTLVSRVPNSFNARSYAEIVRDRAARRKMIADAKNAVNDAYDLEKPVLFESVSERFSITWADSVYDASEPLAFLVDGLITKGSVNLLVGEGGSKKTWAALDLAVCVAAGNNWLDFPTEQTTVLIVDEESGERRLRRRLYETLNGHLIKRGTSVPIAFTSLSMLNLRNLDDVNALHAMIIQTGAGLVIVDALADIMPGADENAVKDVQPLFMNLRRVAESTQAAILVIHHSNKQNGSYRGSTAIKGAVDLMLMVESPTESKYITFSADKARDIEPKVFTAVATWQGEAEQFSLTASEARNKQHLNKGQRFVLGYLLQHGDSALGDIMNNADNCSDTTAKTAVYNLVDSKHVMRTDKGGRGSRAAYDLTESGRELAGKML
jgi:AAA domain-containing protein/DnaB helicase-like protein